MTRKWNISTSQDIDYNIKITDNVLDLSNLDILYGGNDVEPHYRRLIVIDSIVNDIYGKDIIKYLDYHNVEYKIVLLNGGEFEKNVDNLFYLLNEIENFGLNRKSEPIISIGGGVIMDIAGFAASIYRRGVPYIRIPTTLLGMVDVSVAAKTGINYNGRRNRLGTYYPPIISIIDKRFIKTQNDIDISSGIGEILKIAIIKNKELFDIIEHIGDELLISKFDCLNSELIISASIQDMIDELKNNLWEKDLKRLVDFGHSFSPIIEMRSIGTIKELTHGQAVMLDVLFSCVLSYKRNLLSFDNLMKIFKVTNVFKLPIRHDLFCNTTLLIESLKDTMKHRNGDQNLPIPVNIGDAIFINNVSYNEICEVVDEYEKILNLI